MNTAIDKSFEKFSKSFECCTGDYGFVLSTVFAETSVFFCWCLPDYPSPNADVEVERLGFDDGKNVCKEPKIVVLKLKKL